MSARLPGQGALSSQIRHFHQRLVLQRLRRVGEASRADLARAAGLTNTAMGDIIKQLEEQGLVRSVGKRHEGQRGQPATMLSLDPDGAYALGVRLDRSRVETVLIDMGGRVLGHRRHDGLLPSPQRARDIVLADIAMLVALVPAERRARLTGVGVARPDNLGSWHTALDLSHGALAAWDGVAFGPGLAAACGLAVFEENDGTAAAMAELFHGQGRALDDFLYVFIGPAIGGGVVLGGQCVRGQAGHAGDVGLLPAAPSTLASAPPGPARDILLSRASLNALMRHLRFHGIDVGTLGDIQAVGSQADAAIGEWIDDSAQALLDPVLSARALLDLPLVVIDSDLDPAWIDRLIARTEAGLAAALPEARTPPTLLRGSFGAMAGALGAATLPLFLYFGPPAARLLPHAPPQPGGDHALAA